MLIACPECEKQVSDLAKACPGCGFPVGAYMRQAVAELTEEDKVRSARQQHAASRLKSWGDRYLTGIDPSRVPSEGDSFLDRHFRSIVFLLAVVIFILQLVWVFSLFE